MYRTLRDILGTQPSQPRRIIIAVGAGVCSFGHCRRVALLLAWGLCVSVRDGDDQLLDDLAARLAAHVLNLLDLVVCVLLCVIFSLLVARAVL